MFGCGNFIGPPTARRRSVLYGGGAGGRGGGCRQSERANHSDTKVVYHKEIGNRQADRDKIMSD